MKKVIGSNTGTIKRTGGAIIKSSRRTWWLMCIIPVLFVFVFQYLPMFGLVIAFKNYKYDLGIFGSEWVGFENFKFFIHSSDFARITINTLCMNGIFIVVGTTMSVLFALCMFGIKNNKIVKTFQTMAITPYFMSWVIAASMSYAILHPNYGFANQLIKVFGGEGISWYSRPELWPGILTIAYVWKHIGMDSIMYYACLVGIDETYFEAAKIDGAGPVRIAWKIILPCLIPMITMLTIMEIGKIFRADFGLFYQMPRNVGLLYSTTDVVDTYIYRALREVGDIGMSSAAGFLQSVVGFAMVIIANAIVKKITPENSLF